MKGKLLSYNIQDGVGLISGDDGLRYNFISKDWRDSKSPQINQYVDFKVNNDNAEDIFIVIGSDKQKSKIVAGILALFFGPFGVHKFYLGCTAAGFITIILFVFGIALLGIPSLLIAIITFIEGILYLVKSDNEFEEKYVINKKCWF